MTSKSIFRLLAFVLPATLLLGACQADDLFQVPTPTDEGDGLTLTFNSDPMQEYQVTTRSSDPKEDDEKRINQLYIFFFDANGEWLEGSYLTGYQGATGAISEGGYIAPSQGATLLKIATEEGNFTDREVAKNAIIYAVANVESSLFSQLDKNNRPAVLNVADKTPLQALRDMVYKPSTPIFTTLPETGMPMVGIQEYIDLTGETNYDTNDDKRIVQLKALMAHIDVNIQIDSDVSEGNLPCMLLTSWTAKNLPTGVSFTATETGGTTALDAETKTEHTITSTQYIYNRQNSLQLSFYMFENMQQPTGEADYPTGIEEYQKQRYKPTIADANAAAIELSSQYTTYNNATYTVCYTLYLGSNHTNNFEVKRNHQYKNNITIKGLLAHDTNVDDEGETTGEYTYDARVNIEETGNLYYISILRERNHDAHFCVTPMDVYLFDESANPTITVSFADGSDMVSSNSQTPWIRMEYVPASVMQSGYPQDNEHLGYPDEPFHAGTGKRKYFTTDLVTNTLNNDEGKIVTIKNTRDRIYFYIDENLSDTDERTAVVQIEYKDDKGNTDFRTLEITQTHFLEVTDDEGNTFYMEQYEEYLNHYDPLDMYNTDQIYDGLPWATESKEDESSVLVDYEIPQLYSDNNLWSDYEEPHNNYHDGFPYTGFVIYLAGESEMNLNDKPISAFQYCHNKNKRNENGEVPASYGTFGLLRNNYERSNQGKYFLPGIRQMEYALTAYYPIFSEFQDNFYWSS